MLALTLGALALSMTLGDGALFVSCLLLQVYDLDVLQFLVCGHFHKEKSFVIKIKPLDQKDDADPLETIIESATVFIDFQSSLICF